MADGSQEASDLYSLVGQHIRIIEMSENGKGEFKKHEARGTCHPRISNNRERHKASNRT